MKKLVILYNIIFLLAGNVLLANLHILHDHDHDHDHDHESNSDDEYHECEECVNFNNNANYFSPCNNISSVENKFISLRNEYLNNIQSADNTIYSSRAPPLTKNI